MEVMLCNLEIYTLFIKEEVYEKMSLKWPKS